jgi:mannose-1-phosphate guanylyltransferase
MKRSPMYALIMAGGRGTRFWPRSRKAHPKQVLSITGEGTLIQQTVARVSRLTTPDRIFVITNETLRPELLRQLPEVPKEQIISEPLPRNTAPCIGLGAQLIRQRDPNAIMGVFPADHAIAKTPKFLETVRRACRAAEKDHLVVVGIPPRWPETGYGYLEFPKRHAADAEFLPVKSFREKPDEATAKRYVREGNYYWNSGMFFWKAEVFLDALNVHLPRTALQLEAIAALGSKGFERDLAEFFPLCESISVDYGVMEKAENVVGVIASDFGWSDLGSWQAVYELARKDKLGNALKGGNLIQIDAGGNYIDASKTVALLGVDDLVIVDTPDALLVTRRDLAHRVGEVVQAIEKKGNKELL